MLKNIDKIRLLKLRSRVADYRHRRLEAPFGVTKEPFEIQMVLGALDDGYVAHLRSALESSKKAVGGRPKWRAVIREAELALRLWEEFEAGHGTGCLVNIEKWLKCSPAWLIGGETIIHARRLVAEHGEEYREEALSFSLWVKPERAGSTLVTTGF
ncbi:hypothetical protein [Rhizobium sp. NFACC06-2]|uniref:hypothetical protein n=1 Tax=Rhizobium/Agrobacterium group TaxID=227290 RepID=UPI0008773FE6|nr:hypothetical protein [Rhizobium sp. NFACC06-2]SCY12372.1 hypothetical protein SAMN03159288_01351 [Rhizobium sp. NFACC06-2]